MELQEIQDMLSTLQRLQDFRFETDGTRIELKQRSYYGSDENQAKVIAAELNAAIQPIIDKSIKKLKRQIKNIIEA